MVRGPRHGLCDGLGGHGRFPAHRGSVLAAVRASVLREDPYGPAGGLPQLVRVDGGADFLSRTVRRAFGLLGVPVHRMRSARHKGGIERLNRTSMTRFFADLPRYTKAPRLDHSRRVGQEDPPLTFEAFVDLLREWVTEALATPAPFGDSGPCVSAGRA